MEPKAFLDLAQKLSKEEKDEASLRSCVSRSYYALFNIMRQFIDTNVEKIHKSVEAHGEVYRNLFNCNVSEVKQLAMALNDLRTERNSSDYDLELDKFKNPYNVTILFVKARTAFNSFERIISNGGNRKHIKDGIQKYKSSISSHQP